MKKIRSRADAQDLLDHLIETEGRLVMWDLPDSCVIIMILKSDWYGCTILEHEDIVYRGDDLVYFMSKPEIVEMLWNNRKTINAAEHNIKTVFC